MKKLSKKGNVNKISGIVIGVIIAVILVVILVTMAGPLWTSLSTALDTLAGTTIPFAALFNSTAGVVGLIFGAVILLASIVALIAILKSNAR